MPLKYDLYIMASFYFFKILFFIILDFYSIMLFVLYVGKCYVYVEGCQTYEK